MIHEVYAIYDKKEKRYTSPFTAPNKDLCHRMVKQDIDKIPYIEDKELVYIAAYSDDDGLIVGEKQLTDRIPLTVFKTEVTSV